MFLENMPIRKKLVVVIMAVSGTVVMLTCGVFVAYEFITLHRNMILSSTTRAQIIASNSTAALAFQNAADAADVLAALKMDPRMTVACLYDAQGRLFAKYPAESPVSLFPGQPGVSGYRGDHLDIFCPVIQGGRPLGTVYLQSNLSALSDRYKAFGWLTVGIMSGTFLLAYLLSNLFQGQISKPILALAETARAISDRRNFSVRAPKLSRDELGSLTDAFNQMLETLAERTQLLDQVMQSMSEGVVVADLKGKMTYFNAAAQKIIGLGISDQDPSKWAEEYGVFREDQTTPYPEGELPLVKAIQGRNVDGAIQFLRNPGHPEGVFINVNGRPLKDEKGSLVGGLVVLRDITQQRKTDELLKSRGLFQMSVEAVKDYGVIVLDAGGKVKTWNSGAERIKGYKASEIIGKNFEVFYPPEDVKAGKPKALLETAIREGRVEDEGERVRKDGSRFMADTVITAIKDEAGGLTGFIKVTRDVTERRKMEEDLRRLALLVDTSPDFISISQVDGQVLYMNPAGRSLVGVGPATDITRYRREDFNDPGNLRQVQDQSLPELVQRGQWQGEINLRNLQTGRSVPVYIKAVVLRDPHTREATTITTIGRDMTEHKRQQELQLYARALEVSNKEMQDFVFVASHDLQEPLRKIQSFGEFLKDEFKEVLGETGRDYVERMRNAAGRMQTLINDLLALTRVTTKAKPFEPTDLSKVLRDVLSDLEVRIREKGATVEVGSLPTLAADPTQMRQLFQNLIGNALKFQRPGVPPVIRVEGVTLNGKTGPGTCRITVKDNGIGFDNKYAEQIFKVFERLHGRDEYEGTGIGLAVCRKVLERHGGTIKAEATPGQGSLFIIELPVQPKIS